MIVEDGSISKVLQLRANLAVAERVDALKMEAAALQKELKNIYDYGHAVVSPGLVDMHVHMDEPGREHWEGIAAACTGHSSVMHCTWWHASTILVMHMHNQTILHH